jgi:hypothetical protein
MFRAEPCLSQLSHACQHGYEQTEPGDNVLLSLITKLLSLCIAVTQEQLSIRDYLHRTRQRKNKGQVLHLFCSDSLQ